jgi:DNA-binding GntR family transcriptional regulator
MSFFETADTSVPTASTLVDEIAFRIQKGILDGELLPGEHLIQAELCERFHVSRTPVREALRRLEAQGLVDLPANRTATVRRPTPRHVAEVYHVRAALEAYACELAATRVTPIAIAQLEAVQANLEAAAQGLLAAQETLDESLQSRYHEELRLHNDRFHGIVDAASECALLTEAIANVWHAVPKDYVWRALHHDNDVIELHSVQHRAIIEALVARDADQARKAMRDHILH